MNKDVLFFKALQNKNHYRNPKAILAYEATLNFTNEELMSAQREIEDLLEKGIQFTYPTHEHYPKSFLLMKEPPLFLEFIGEPSWTHFEFLSVVGARKCHDLSRAWLEKELPAFLVQNPKLGIVSGGAIGVDQVAHIECVKSHRPTVVILPCGLGQMYPENLKNLKQSFLNQGSSFMSEFSLEQKIHKSNFYFRNRLIVALGKMCLVVQAQEKSGTFLSVHHALENGRPVLTIPAHPCMRDFLGNIKLMNDGAQAVSNFRDLSDFWAAESWTNQFFD